MKTSIKPLQYNSYKQEEWILESKKYKINNNKKEKFSDLLIDYWFSKHSTLKMRKIIEDNLFSWAFFEIFQDVVKLNNLSNLEKSKILYSCYKVSKNPYFLSRVYFFIKNDLKEDKDFTTEFYEELEKNSKVEFSNCVSFWMISKEMWNINWMKLFVEELDLFLYNKDSIRFDDFYNITTWLNVYWSVSKLIWDKERCKKYLDLISPYFENCKNSPMNLGNPLFELWNTILMVINYLIKDNKYLKDKKLINNAKDILSFLRNTLFFYKEIKIEIEKTIDHTEAVFYSRIWDHKRVIDILTENKKPKYTDDHHRINTLVNSYIKTWDYKKALNILEEFSKNNTPDNVITTTLSNILEKLNNPEDIIKILTNNEFEPIEHTNSRQSDLLAKAINSLYKNTLNTSIDIENVW